MNRKKPQAPSTTKVSNLRSFLPQILAASVKNILLLAFGMSLGFPTILIPSLSGGNPEEIIELDQHALSWIGSINLLCVPLGSLFSGYVTQLIGRRKSMQFVTLPFLASWLIFYFSSASWHVFFACCLTGFSGGLMEAPVHSYLAEVTTPNLRGILASTSTVAVISGVLIQFLLGTFLHWRVVAIYSVIPPILACFLLFFVPESPFWLVSKNRLKEAQKSLAWLRGWLKFEDVAQEFTDFCTQVEFQQKTISGISLSNNNNKNSLILNIKNNLKIYTKKNFLWPFGLVILTFFLGHFCGMTTLQTYAVNIFATLEAPINEYYATIGLGVAEVLGCFLSSFFVHFVGKRRLNFFSLCGNGLCFFIVAAYAQINGINYLNTSRVAEETVPVNNDENPGWIPMSFLILSAFFSHSSIRLLPWMLVGEVYYSEIRATASGFSAAISYLIGFLSNKIFFFTISVLTLPGTFWLYSIVSFSGLLALYFWLPETEGKTLFEITEHFNNGQKLSNNVKANKLQKINNLKTDNNEKDNMRFENIDNVKL